MEAVALLVKSDLPRFYVMNKLQLLRLRTALGAVSQIHKELTPSHSRGGCSILEQRI